MSIKRRLFYTSIIIIVLVLTVGYYFLQPEKNKYEYKYEIILDDIVNGYSKLPVLFHATIKTDCWYSSIGWDIDQNGIIDENAIRIDIVSRPWDYDDYTPWQTNSTANEIRYYSYHQYNQTGDYTISFIFFGPDGWHKKETTVHIVDPNINIVISPTKNIFQRGDNIIFRAMVRNDGPYPIRTTQPLIHGYALDASVIIPNGTRVEKYSPYGISVPNEPGPNVIVLKPGETNSTDDQYSINLTYRYLFFGNLSMGITDYDFNDTGIYFVSFEYRIGIGDGAWNFMCGTRFEIVE